MPAFLKKTGIKVVCGILCVLLLAVGGACGVLSIWLYQAGGYSGSGESSTVFAYMIRSQLENDIYFIMDEYFDPNDPTEPWKSYYSGGIFTGEQTNFLWEITDSDGETVLSTYDGEYSSYSDTEDFWFDTSEAVSAELYTVESSYFYCGDTFYSYDRNSETFLPISGVDSKLSDVPAFDSAMEQVGFSYDGLHYDFYGDSFYSSGEAQVSYHTATAVYTIHYYLLEGLPYQDAYQSAQTYSENFTFYRYEILAGAIGGLVLGLVLLLVLCLSVGRVNGCDEAVLNPIRRIPGELSLVFAAVLLLCGLVLAAEFTGAARISGLVFLGCGASLAAVAVCYGLTDFCARIKTHTLWKNTICRWLLEKLSRLWSSLKAGTGALFRHLPLIWKVMLVYLLLCVVELIGLSALSWYGSGLLYLLWAVEKLLLGGAVAYVCLCFLRLKTGAERISAGDYGAAISTDHLILDFKDTAETLNHIQDGVTAAVDSRMKSERLKTELITNVSHDLKTPLTSIVSYVDLLKQEPAGSPAAAEYLEVLDRQSARLKKLVEDLVEASKASTGNIAVHAEPLDLRMLLHQALGEYAERLEKAELTPVAKLPENPVMISADGRLLWRIFDNLLGNAVKYAMPGTRFYVSMTADSHAIVTFRNISRDPLDVSPDELIERFVRGDASRHTEGSGLGLSIAKSLAESMGGEFILAVDGDLFKAAVIFPVLPRQDAEALAAE